MLFDIRHTTRYGYSGPVFCEPLTVRLRPRDDARQRLLRYDLRVTPLPAGDTALVDADGNSARRVWFSGPTDSLELVSVARVETLQANPFEFLLEPESLRLPLDYPASSLAALAPYRQPPASAEVGKLADELLQAAGGDSLEFLMELARWIAARFEKIVRPEGPAWPSERTLGESRGSCRDFSVLYNDCCRAVGLAARFVSGYHADEPADGGGRYLHAWSEVYLPGAGWIGFDPGSGLAVADRHVAVAASALPEGTAPTAGAFRGSGIRSEMQVEVQIESHAGRP